MACGQTLIPHPKIKNRWGICFAPGELLGDKAGGRFSDAVEEIIGRDYRAWRLQQGGSASDDWFDERAPNTERNKIGWATYRFLDYLARKNPSGLNRKDVAGKTYLQWLQSMFSTNPDIRLQWQKSGQYPPGIQISNQGRMGWPDIITYSNTLKEYYEIKSGGKNYIYAAREKWDGWEETVLKFTTMFPKKQGRGTTYKGGSYNLTPFAGTLFGLNREYFDISVFDAVLTWELAEPGLLLYCICIDVQFKKRKNEEVVKSVITWAAQSIILAAGQGFVGDLRVVQGKRIRPLTR